MPYCRGCGDQFSGSATYCRPCELDIIDRAKSSVQDADTSEQNRMRNDKNYAHSWLQNVIGWIVDLMPIISKIFTGGCYVTSALVKHKGLPDNCYQMELFREFRKNYILNSKDKSRIDDLDQYYFYGQFISKWIESRTDSKEIWTFVDIYITKFTKMLEEKDFENAYNYFKQNTLSIKQEVLIENHK